MNKRILLTLLCLLLAGSLSASTPEPLAYLETFPPERKPSRYLRIAQAAESWEILEENGIRFLRVTIQPTARRQQGLIVWDLAPVQFLKLAVEVRPSAPGIYFHAASQDRQGASYQFKYFGETEAGGKRRALNPNQWNRYEVRLPNDLERVRVRGEEVSPFVHAAGEELSRWESIDFDNLGHKTLYFHAALLPNSPHLGKTITVDFRFLELQGLTTKDKGKGR